MTMELPILVVEDDESLALGLLQSLELDGFTATTAGTLCRAREILSAVVPGEWPCRLIILDLMLPDGSGLDLLRYVRSHFPALPVLILSARSSELDKVLGLERGADDFVAKPFSLRELTARVKALLRRSSTGVPEKKDGSLQHGLLNFDPAARVVQVDGLNIDLSHTEFRILALLIRNQGIVVARSTLLERLWEGEFIDPRSLDPHISRLRRKLGPCASWLETVPQVGYKLVLPETC